MTPNRKIIYLAAVALNAMLFPLCTTTGAVENTRDENPDLIFVGEGWAANSVNTTIFRCNSVVTCGQEQYTSYYAPDGHVMLAKRTIGAREWTVQKTKFKGNIRDAHNGISMMVDGAGYIHISWDHHGNPLRYAVSKEPFSLELGEMRPMTGENEKVVTYPEFHRLSNGDLVFFYRNGASGAGDLLMNRYDVSSGTWIQVCRNLIDGEKTRNAYWQATVDSHDVIHVSWVWRETPDVSSNHDLCYIRSRDGGATWEKSDGLPCPIPVTAGAAEYVVKIPENSELMNTTSMTCDSKGNPYICNYWRSSLSGIPQYHIVYHDGKEWIVLDTGFRTTDFSLQGSGTKRIPISRPQIVVADNDSGPSVRMVFRDEERGNKVSMAVCNDLRGNAWELSNLTDFSVGSWEPSLDTELWRNKGRLHLFVQETDQVDAEGVSDMEPRPVFILEVDRIAQVRGIIPVPVSVVPLEGRFTVSADVNVRVQRGTDGLHHRAEIFTALMEPVVAGRMKTLKGRPKNGAVNLTVDTALGEEEYVLEITDRRVDIAGGSPVAVFYGLQSMRQLVQTAPDGSLFVEAQRIEDAPRFAYRGAHLDVGRYFYPVEQVKTYLDIMAMHKLNRFHWHLTEDHGWRIESERYPRLNSVGSWRSETLVGHPRDSKVYDGKPHGGYYTKAEMREIVQYASDRGITVIPEIDMPGHASAALAAYPEMGCTGGPYEVAKTWRLFDDSFCPGNERTFEILCDVLDELIEIFPSEYIHIGGDECRKTRWHACTKCRRRMEDEKLKDVEELQSYFVKRIEKHVNSRGRKIIGWEEIMEGGVSQTATVMSWRGTEAGIAAAKMGNAVIMAPASHCYLDYYPTRNVENEPLAIGGFTPIEKTYSLNPCAGLNPEQQKFILGVQGNLWTEFISDFDKVQYMLLPRLAAVAETGWSYGRKTDFENFAMRMNFLRRLYDSCGYSYGKHIFSPVDKTF